LIGPELSSLPCCFPTRDSHAVRRDGNETARHPEHPVREDATGGDTVRAARKSNERRKKENGGRDEGPWCRGKYITPLSWNSHRESCHGRGAMETTNVARFVDHADRKSTTENESTLLCPDQALKNKHVSTYLVFGINRCTPCSSLWGALANDM
jgi:hypothetical protein